MSNSDFDVEDASGNQEPEQYGGEVDLSGLKPIGRPNWDLGTPDPNAPLKPIDGGAVGRIQTRVPDVAEPPAEGAGNQGGFLWDVKKQLVQLTSVVVLVVTVFLGFGFVLVVNNDVAHNNLNLETYVKTVGYIVGGLLTALGLVKGVGALTRRPGDGSG